MGKAYSQRWTRKEINKKVPESKENDISISVLQFDNAADYFRSNTSLIRILNTNTGERREYLNNCSYVEIHENYYSPEDTRLDTIEIFSKNQNILEEIAKKAELPLKSD